MKGSERTARILVNDSRIYLDTDALARGAVDFLLPGAIKCEECGYDLRHGYVVVEAMADSGGLECFNCQVRYPILRGLVEVAA